MFLALILSIVSILVMVLPSVCRADTTKISDIIIPEKFSDYSIQKTMEQSNLVASGIIENTAEFDKLANGGGRTIAMPYFKDLTGESEVLHDDRALTPGKITTGSDVAVLLARGKAWSTNDLAGLLAGADPMAAIASLVGGFWARDLQLTLLKILEGVFGAATMADKVHDITGESNDAACFTANSFVDALALMGDAQELLTGVMIHSATRASLVKQNLIATVKPSDGSPDLEFFMGKRVIVNDKCPVPDTGKYVSYIFGQGAIALGTGKYKGVVPVEVGRDSLKGEDVLVNRKTMILHPRGVKWTAPDLGEEEFPTNDVLATGTSWQLVYEPKAVRIVKFYHKLKA